MVKLSTKSDVGAVVPMTHSQFWMKFIKFPRYGYKLLIKRGNTNQTSCNLKKINTSSPRVLCTIPKRKLLAFCFKRWSDSRKGWYWKQSASSFQRISRSDRRSKGPNTASRYLRNLYVLNKLTIHRLASIDSCTLHICESWSQIHQDQNLWTLILITSLENYSKKTSYDFLLLSHSYL